MFRTVDACKDIGLPLIDDINSPTHPAIGCGLLHFTRDQNQYRHSTYHAFLPKDLALSRRQHLHIVTNTIVERVQIKNSDNGKPVARGIDVISRSGKEMKSVGARKEVILCAGPFGSPHILMLSGVGPADHLEEHDIEIVKDLPAVGSNLVRISCLYLCLDLTYSTTIGGPLWSVYCVSHPNGALAGGFRKKAMDVFH